MPELPTWKRYLTGKQWDTIAGWVRRIMDSSHREGRFSPPPTTPDELFDRYNLRRKMVPRFPRLSVTQLTELFHAVGFKFPFETEDEPTPAMVDLKCSRRGCDGSIDVPDEGAIYDGEAGHCDTCGREYVAVAYEDGSMKMEHRPE